MLFLPNLRVLFYIVLDLVYEENKRIDISTNQCFSSLFSIVKVNQKQEWSYSLITEYMSILFNAVVKYKTKKLVLILAILIHVAKGP